MPGPLTADQQYTLHITAPRKHMSIQYTETDAIGTDIIS